MVSIDIRFNQRIDVRDHRQVVVGTLFVDRVDICEAERGVASLGADERWS